MNEPLIRFNRAVRAREIVTDAVNGCKALTPGAQGWMRPAIVYRIVRGGTVAWDAIVDRLK